MLCEQIAEIEVVKAFDSSRLLLMEAPQLDFDFCILDIQMPEIDGLQTANLLQGKPVIFATAHKEYAADAFDMNALDYIRKPITEERLRQAIQKVVLALSNTKKNAPKISFQINTNRGRSVIFFKDLCYIVSSKIDARDKTVRLAGGEVVVLKNITFKKLMQMLPAQSFCRINIHEAIALNTVQFFSHDEITTNIVLPNGKYLVLTLGDAYREVFLQKINI
jgi:DNA-binding LytR/AlgR family response regulator